MLGSGRFPRHPTKAGAVWCRGAVADAARCQGRRTQSSTDLRRIEILTDDEVTSLIRACSRRAPTGIRNAALVAVMYRAGLRVSEALAL